MALNLNEFKTTTQKPKATLDLNSFKVSATPVQKQPDTGIVDTAKNYVGNIKRGYEELSTSFGRDVTDRLVGKKNVDAIVGGAKVLVDNNISVKDKTKAAATGLWDFFKGVGQAGKDFVQQDIPKMVAVSAQMLGDQLQTQKTSYDSWRDDFRKKLREDDPKRYMELYPTGTPKKEVNKDGLAHKGGDWINSWAEDVQVGLGLTQEETFAERGFDPSASDFDPKNFGYGFGKGASSIAAYAGLTYVTKSPDVAAGFLGWLEGSDVYTDAKNKLRADNPDLSEGEIADKAARLAVLAGTGNAVLERIGMDALYRNVAGGALRNYTMGAVTETLQETTQTVWINAVEKYGYDRSKSLFDDISQTVIFTMPIGFLAGGMLRGQDPTGRSQETLQSIEDHQGMPINDAIKNGDIAAEKIFQKPSGSVDDQITSLTNDPSTTKLYRGQKGTDGVGQHFTNDPTWINNFGDTSYSGALPADAKIKVLTGADMEAAFQEGLMTDEQLYQKFFNEGYDAVVGTDARNGGIMDVIVSPEMAQQFEQTDISKTAKFTKEYAQGRLDDVAQKLAKYNPALETEFRSKVDVESTSMQEMLDLAKQLVEGSAPVDPSQITFEGRSKPAREEVIDTVAEKNPDIDRKVIEEGYDAVVPVLEEQVQDINSEVEKVSKIPSLEDIRDRIDRAGETGAALDLSTNVDVDTAQAIIQAIKNLPQAEVALPEGNQILETTPVNIQRALDQLQSSFTQNTQTLRDDIAALSEEVKAAPKNSQLKLKKKQELQSLRSELRQAEDEFQNLLVENARSLRKFLNEFVANRYPNVAADPVVDRVIDVLLESNQTASVGTIVDSVARRQAGNGFVPTTPTKTEVSTQPKSKVNQNAKNEKGTEKAVRKSADEKESQPQDKYSIKEDAEVGFVVREKKGDKNVVLGTFSTKEKADIYRLEQELQDVYDSAGNSEFEGFTKFDEVLSQIMVEMEIAEPGTRLFMEDGSVQGISSTFPKWMPESLRSSKLFSAVMEGLARKPIMYPAGNRTKQRELYQAILDEVDAQLNVDTSAIRDEIISNYAKDQTEDNNKKRTANKAKGSRKGEKTKPGKVTDRAEFSLLSDAEKAAVERARTDGGVFRLKKTMARPAEESIENAVAYLEDAKKRLGIDFDVHFAEAIYGTAPYDMFSDLSQKIEAEGLMTDNTIVLSKLLSEYAAQHELGHLVFANLEEIDVFKKAGITQEKLLKAQTELDGDKAKKKGYDAEEELMLGFEQYLNGKSKPTGIIAKFYALMKKLYTQIMRVIARDADVITNFYELIDEGRRVDNTILKLKSRGLVNEFLNKPYFDLDAYRFGTPISLKKKKADFKNIHREDLGVMVDFIDTVRFRKEDIQLEIDARRVAEYYGMNPNVSNGRLASAFQRAIEKEPLVYKKAIARPQNIVKLKTRVPTYVAFHGTDKNFDKYIPQKGKRSILLSQFEVETGGIFFAATKEGAEQYGSIIKEALLSPKKALVSEAEVQNGFSGQKLKDAAYIFDPLLKISEYTNDFGTFKQYYVELDGLISEIGGSAKNSTPEKPKDSWVNDKLWGENGLLWDAFDNPQVAARMIEKGYDFAVVDERNDDVDGFSYFVPDVNIIKDATGKGVKLKIRDNEGREIKDKLASKLAREHDELIDKVQSLEDNAEVKETELRAALNEAQKAGLDLAVVPDYVKDVGKNTEKKPPYTLTKAGKEKIEELGLGTIEQIQAQVEEYARRRNEFLETRKMLREVRKQITESKGATKETKQALKDVERRLKLRKEVLKKKAFYVNMGVKRGYRKGLVQGRKQVRENIRETKARDAKISKLKAIYKRVKMATKTGNYLPLEYQRRLLDLFEGFDFTTMNETTRKKLESMSEFFAGQDGEIPSSIADKLQRLSKTPIGRMSDLELDAFLEEVLRIYENGILKQKLLRTKDEKILKENVKKLTESLVPFGKDVPGKEKDALINKLRRNVNKASATVYDPARFADLVDGSQGYRGEHYTQIVNPTRQAINDAEHETNILLADTLEELKEIADEFTEDEMIRMTYFSALDQGATEQADKLREFYSSRVEKDGGKVNFANPITVKEQQALDILRRVYKNIRPQVAATYEAMNNKPFPNIENYMPLRYDRDVETFDIDENPFDFDVKKTSQGFTIARENKVDRVLETDIFATFVSQVKKQVYYAKVQPELENIKELVNSREYQAKADLITKEYWGQFVTDVATNGRGHRGWFERVMDWARGNMVVAILYYKISTVLIQVSGAFDGAMNVKDELGWTTASKILPEMIRLVIQKSRLDNSITESTELANRMGGQIDIAEINDMYKGVFSPSARVRGWNMYKRGGAAGIRYVDQRVATAVYDVLRDGYIKKGLSREDAIARAEQIMVLSQSSHNVANRPQLLNSSGAKFAFPFSSFIFNAFNNLRYDAIVKNLKQHGNLKGSIKAGGSVSFLAMAISYEVFMYNILSAAFGYESDDDEPWWKRYFASFMGRIPGAGYLVGWDGNIEGLRVNNPTVEAASKAVKSTVSLFKDGATMKEAYDATKSTLVLLGFPGAQQLHQFLTAPDVFGLGSIGRELGISYDDRRNAERRVDEIRPLIESKADITTDTIEKIAADVYGKDYIEGDIGYKTGKKAEVIREVALRQKYGFEDSLVNVALDKNSNNDVKAVYAANPVDLDQYKRPVELFGVQNSLFSDQLYKELAFIQRATPEEQAKIARLAQAETDSERDEIIQGDKAFAKKAFSLWKVIQKPYYESI